MKRRSSDENAPLISSDKEVPVDANGKPLTEEEIEKQKQRSKMLMISFILMVVFGLGNKIFQKLQTIPMHNYVSFTIHEKQLEFNDYPI